MASPTQIKEKFTSIVTRKTKLDDQLKKLQKNCVHFSLIKKNNSNTGNYDSSSNSYWTVFYCQDCGKYWEEEQK